MLTKILSKKTKQRTVSKLDDEDVEYIMENSFWRREQITDLYSKFLTNHPNGKITRNEFNNMFKSLPWTNHNIQLFYFVFNAIDKNADGFIDFSEALLSYSIIYNSQIIKNLKQYDLNITSSLKEIEIMIEYFHENIFQQDKNNKNYKNVFKRFTKFITSNQAFGFLLRRHSV